MKQSENINNELFNKMKEYLSFYIDKPIIELIESNSLNNIKISSMFIITKELIENIYISNDAIELERVNQIVDDTNKEDYLNALDSFIKTGIPNEHVIELRNKIEYDKNVLPFIFREINWILISILSASYTSARVLMRSLFEMVIKYLTTKTKSCMGDMIDGIKILKPEDKRYIKNEWKIMNKWAHPYGHWLKEICPIFWNNPAFYHEKHCENCINSLTIIFELLILLSYRTFEIKDDKLKEEIINAGKILNYKLLNNYF